MRHLRTLPVMFVLVFGAALSAPAQEPAAAPAPAATPDTSAAKAEPVAKSQEELDAHIANSNTQDLGGAETAAEDFVKKYPYSQLPDNAFIGLMQRYHQSNKGEKTVGV